MRSSPTPLNGERWDFFDINRRNQSSARSCSLTINETTSGKMRFICLDCRGSFKRRFDLQNHINHTHGEKNLEKCLLCGQIFISKLELEEHFRKYHKPKRAFIVKESAFNRKFITHRYTFIESNEDFEQAQNNIKKLIEKKIVEETAEKFLAKISLIFFVEMIMIDHQGEKISRATVPFRSPSFFANAQMVSSISQNIQKSFFHQRNSFEQFMKNGSNWQYQRALAFDVEVAALKPIRAGSGDYASQCYNDETSNYNEKKYEIASLKNKRWLYNPNNKDQKCFLYCIAYFLLFGLVVNKGTTLIERKEMKKLTHSFNLKKISFPTSLEDVKKFLKQNRDLDLKLNVLYQNKDGEIFPLEIGLGDGKKLATLLLHEFDQKHHFCLVTNVDKYLRDTYTYRTNNDKTKLSYQKAIFCLNCLNHFQTKKLRDSHFETCMLNKPRKEITPEKGFEIIKFKNHERQHMTEMIGFLDFECVLPDSKTKCENCKTLKCKCEMTKTDEINQQLPITYSFVIIGPNNEIMHEHTKSCDNAHIDFLSHLLEQEQSWIKPLLEKTQLINMAVENEISFLEASRCYLCGIYFSPEIVKCRDHSHFTGEFLGAACQRCNLRRRRPINLKIFIHNASKYDMHFLIKGLSSFSTKIKNLSVLPFNGEHFRTMRFNCFEIFDSLAFLQSSLSALSTNLQQTDHDYPILKQTYLVKKNGRFNKDRFQMVLGKSFFPYEYCKNLDLMKDTKSLPPRKHFYSSLSEEFLSQNDYEFAKSIWKEFNCRNLLDYAELYCKIDTILLAEIFQSFRQKMHSFTGLDPAYYVSLPAFGYDSMLKMTRVKIELPTDINMIHFMESAKRGGVSFINTRFLSAAETDESEIVYIDRNNLYGEAQMQKLPHKDFRWLTEKEIKTFDLNSDFDGDKGYFIECDLHYPEELHRQHSNLPLAPEMLEVTFDNLSPFSKKAVRESEGKSRYKDVKLMSTFHDRIKYVTHIKNLMLYLSLGMVLKKIHRVLEFTQSRIFAPYIEKTTEARQSSKSKFEMDFYKLMVRFHYKPLVTPKTT
jgi:hypothetical protein